MVAYYERRTSHAAYWSRRIAIFAAVLFLVAGLAHRGQLVSTPDFIRILAVVGGLAGVALACAVWGFARLWQRGDRGGRASAWGTAIALLVLAPFLVSAWWAIVHPRLTGVSTDRADPPEFSAALRGRSADMNPIGPISEVEAALQAEGYPDLTGRRYPLPADQVTEAIEELITTRGWQVLGRQGQTGARATVEALARSFLLGFPADVAIRVSDAGDSTSVDMRAVSRYGRHDLGENARLISSFLTDLDTAIAERPVQ